MRFLEKDLEEIVFNADKEVLEERGLNMTGVLKRQLRIGNYGIADIVGFTRDYIYDNCSKDLIPVLYIDVYELKKDVVNIFAFMQAIRYCRGISRYLNVRGKNINVLFNIYLIGNEIDLNSELAYITDLINSKESNSINSVYLYTYEYELDGLRFKEQSDFRLTNEGFE